MFSKQHRIWSFHVVVLQRTAKKCTKNYQCPCTAIVLLFKSIFGGVLVTVAVVFCVRSLLTSRTSSPCDWYYVNMFRIWQKLNKANENSLKLCSRVYNLFNLRRKRQNKKSAFQFLQFEERFRETLFSWRIRVDGRPNRRNKGALSNSSGEVWMLHA